MERNLFIGIDFSKKTLDVSVIRRRDLDSVSCQQFENSRSGCSALPGWLKPQTEEPPDRRLFCGEHTGLYSVVLSEFSVKKGLFMWLENPLQIKQSGGMKRDKSDRADSRETATYACRFEDRARAYALPDRALKSLELLPAFRERPVNNKRALPVSPVEIRRVM
jgi:transposase